MARRKSELEVIREATIQLGLLREGKKFDASPIMSFARTLRSLSTNWDGIKRQLPDLTDSIEKAIQRYYPHPDPWDNGHRTEVLDEYIQLLEKAGRGEPLKAGQIDEARSFGSAIGEGFAEFHKIPTDRRRPAGK